LVESTIANLSKQDAARALTGTFKRGDRATVLKHLAALKDANLPEALRAYVVLGQRSISIARRLSGAREDLDQIARILSRAAREG
jgi:predicted short-subunit dehydrogenase-like oxidoreductase (DUF2520 family)